MRIRARTTPGGLGPIDILVVCTGNFCRSPLAEAQLLATVPSSLRVASAGTQGMREHHPHPYVSEVLMGQGIDEQIIDGLKPKRITGAMIHSSRLILVAAVEHRREVVQLSPGKADRTYTFREFARLVDDFVPGGHDSQERLESFVVEAAKRLQQSWKRGEMSRGDDEDIPDPLHGSRADFERCFADILSTLAWTDRL